MEVTVAVIAHDPEQFFAEAVRSVRSGTVRPDEVLLIRYTPGSPGHHTWEDGTIEIDTEEKGLGAKLDLALAWATGDVVCFLEDDDLFAPTKLDKVHHAFGLPGNPVFFHDPIAEKGNVIPERAGGSLLCWWATGRPRGTNDVSVQAIRRHRLDSNVSSMVVDVRRFRDRDIRNLLRKTRIFADAALFASALSTSRHGAASLVSAMSPLTFCRPHAFHTMSRPELWVDATVEDAVRIARLTDHPWRQDILTGPLYKALTTGLASQPNVRALTRERGGWDGVSWLGRMYGIAPGLAQRIFRRFG